MSEIKEKQKKPWYKKWWVWLIVGIVVIAVANGGSDDSPKTATNETSSTQSTKQTAYEKKLAQAIEVDKKVLFNDYMANPISADAEYKDKVLKITGVISSIDREIAQQPYINFNMDTYGFETIRMTFNREEEEKVTQLSKGETVTIIGTCNGTLLSTTVALKDCYLVIE